MVKDRRPTAKSVSATLIAVTAITLAASYLGAFESLGAWARQREPGQLGGLLAASIVLAVALGFYCWRGRSKLRRKTTRHEREIARLEREVARLRRTREALQRNEATYRGVVASLPVALFAIDPEGMFTLSEGTGLELLGLEPDKVVGRSIFETYRDAPQVVENVRLALGGQASGAIVEVGGRAFEMRYSPLRDNGDFSGVLGVAADVTERRRAEDRLREAEARYRTLVEQIPAITYVEELARNGKVLAFISPQYEAMLGHSPEEGVPHPEYWFGVVHPDDRERVLAEDKRTDESLEPFRAEYRMIARDGRIVWVRDEAVLVRDERGEPLFWQGVMHDITERMGAEEALRESERHLSTLLANAPAYLYRCRNEPDWPNEFVSDYALELTGYTPDELTDGTVLFGDLIAEGDRQRVWDEVQEALAKYERIVLRYAIRRKDGETRYVEEHGQGVYGEDGGVEAIEGVVYDVTERVRAEEALKKSETILAEAQRMAHLGSWEWDLRSGQVRWSDETFRIYGFAPQAFIPTFHKLLEVVHPEDRKTLREHLEAALQEGEPYDFEHRIVRPDGEVRVVHRRAEVVRDESGEPIRMLGTVHDVTERKALEERLEHQALHDPLTDLPNRALFTDRLRQALSRAKRRRRLLAVLFMDLDNFKVINDSLGHRAGDRVLVAASKRVRSILRPEDTVARLGGDEFIFLLEDADAAGAVRAAERILEQLRAPFSVGGRRLFVMASIGIALGGVNGKQAADLLRDADLAMYRAKHSGKARYAVFEEEMNALALERLELEHDLRRALEREEFRVYYQPQMLLDTNLQRHPRSVGSRAIVARTVTQAPRIMGVEALVRWEHPERGPLLPDDFIPLAEETGLIVDIGEAVLAEACRRTKEWQARFPSDPPLAVCVNLSARQFREPGLTETVRRVLAETDLDPTCLHLEITESTAMGDAPATVATLEELKDLGVRMIIDDFGTGYSSLSYLERFPVDHVKIDRSFVAKLGEDPGATALVSGMIRLAHSLGLKVIAEGVETKEQLGRLQGLGCDFAQGHYFSEPLPGEAVGTLLKTNALGG